jgi:hypothetical protein
VINEQQIYFTFPLEKRMEDMEFLKAMLAEMNANMKSMLEKMEAETEAIRVETKAMRDKRMEANRNAWREETMFCQVMTVACLDSKDPNAKWNIGRSLRKRPQ